MCDFDNWPARRAVFAVFVAAALVLGGCSFDPATDGEEDNQWEFGGEDDADTGVVVDADEPSNNDPILNFEDENVPEPDVYDGPDDPDVQFEPDSQDDLDAQIEPDAQDEPDVQDEPDAQVEPDVQDETCNGQSVDLSTDPDHCGACDNSCDPDFGTCTGGVCACSGDLEVCGDQNRCEDVDFDPNHCGGCGIECGPGEACQGGDCVCRSGFIECGGECVDPERNPNHCGDCDQECGLGHCEEGECGSGDCGFSHFDCEPQDTDGIACMPWQGASNSLYCAPDLSNSCGETCSGDEVCRPGAGCRDYRAARGCDSCPCDDCSLEEQCADDVASFDGVFCASY